MYGCACICQHLIANSWKKISMYNFTSCTLFQTSMCILIVNMFLCLTSSIIERYWWYANLENIVIKVLIFINTCTLTRKAYEYTKLCQCFYLPSWVSPWAYHDNYYLTKMFHVWELLKGLDLSGSEQLPSSLTYQTLDRGGTIATVYVCLEQWYFCMLPVIVL